MDDIEHDTQGSKKRDPTSTSTSAISQAIGAADALDPGLQQLYAEKFGKSIQDDIASAANTTSGNATASSSAAAPVEVRTVSTELVEYWSTHSVTHGQVATGGGRELLRCVLCCHYASRILSLLSEMMRLRCPASFLMLFSRCVSINITFATKLNCTNFNVAKISGGHARLYPRFSTRQ